MMDVSGLESRLRAGLIAALHHAMEATCGYSPPDAELEQAVRAGLDAFRAGAGPET